jgi:hypothetical protein
MISTVDAIDAAGRWRSQPARTVFCREVIGTFAA